MKNKFVSISLLALVLPLTACMGELDLSPDDDQEWTENIDEVEQAASNITMKPGQTATFPTWCCWGWTNVKATNNSSSSYGTLLLQVGGASETLNVPPGQTNQVGRQWAAAKLQITNKSTTASLNVEVW